MKFAKELEDDLVPEWRIKYINYKTGKKKIKAIAKALKAIQKSPKGRPQLLTRNSSALIPYTQYDFNSRAPKHTITDERANTVDTVLDGKRGGNGDDNGSFPSDNLPKNIRKQLGDLRTMSATKFTHSPPLHATEDRSKQRKRRNKESSEEEDAEVDDDADDTDVEDDEQDEGQEIEELPNGENTPLKKSRTRDGDADSVRSYGSVDSDMDKKPTSIPNTPRKSDGMPRLNLPDPALAPTSRPEGDAPEQLSLSRSRSDAHVPVKKSKDDKPETKRSRSHNMIREMFQRKKDQGNQPQSAEDTRLFKPRQIDSPDVSKAQQEAYTTLDARQDDFFNFLDKELDKIETFYRQKEGEAQHRLNQLRAQLHEHRDQRARDIRHAQQGHSRTFRQDGILGGALAETPINKIEYVHHGTKENLFGKVFKSDPKIGKTSKAMENLASPPDSPETLKKGRQEPKRVDTMENLQNARDYTRKKPDMGNASVPHKFAKRRLKLAMQEFYRGLELLKSYALLNRTGFRKINKKYDKAVNARPPLRYLNEKVNDAHFVKSTIVDEYLVAVEDLYARYFERGNRKVAVSKLRSRLQAGDHSGSTFRNGLWLAAGTGLGIAGIINGGQYLFNADPTISLQTSYLLQLYAGYFLALLLFLLFVLDCKIWTAARINYVFVFEYDTRHVLDWRQLAEIPCFFLFLNGLFLWLNFEFGQAHRMFLYWPILLIGITLAIMALPFRILYYNARKWWAFSNFRLLLAGIYPVEFRDFFLGDMYCSETYTMSQLELFFCLYRSDFVDPARCNSNHSMLLGFFTTLPAIWRFLQCVRRYKDSGKWFPHLANCAKYLGNIIYYMMLSLYRLNINESHVSRYRAAFIVFALINGVYCSFWDVFMDWSLGNFFSKHKGLRDHLAYRRPWVYYTAIVINVVLRQQWVLYAIFTHDLQHSAIMSFFVALAEVLRRGLWTLFRVENEHTNNVTKFRASRDIPLPYSLPQSPGQKAKDEQHKKDFTKKSKSTLVDSPMSQKDRDRASDVINRWRSHLTSSTTGRDSGDLERQGTEDSGSTLRNRTNTTPALRAIQRVGTAIAAAHTQDFEKKRRPEVVGDTPQDEAMLKDGAGDSSDDDGDEHYHHEIEGSENDEDEWEERGHDNRKKWNLTRSGNTRDSKTEDKDDDTSGESRTEEEEVHNNSSGHSKSTHTDLKNTRRQRHRPDHPDHEDFERRYDNEAEQRGGDPSSSDPDGTLDEDGEGMTRMDTNQRAHHRARNENERDMNEVRQLAQGYHPASGLRGSRRPDDDGGGKGKKRD